MSYHEKKALWGIITALLVIAGYGIFTFNRFSTAQVKTNDLKFWAGSELIFIIIGVIITVIIRFILISSTMIRRDLNHKSKLSVKIKAVILEDEMDKLIARKTSNISYGCTGLGFIAALISILSGFSASVMINVLFYSISFGSVIEGIAILYYYKVGVANA